MTNPNRTADGTAIPEQADKTTNPNSEIECDLMIVGSGMTGMAAALFAAERKIDAVLAGTAGGLHFASGLMDLMGVHPVEDGRIRDNPWEAIDELRRDIPGHPYAKIQNRDIEKAFEILLSFLSRHGLNYHREPDRNIRVATPAGTVKTTYCVPKTMFEGVLALERRTPSLIVDFHGLKGFGARQIAETLKSRWPGLTPCRLRFPEARGELFPEYMGRMLELPRKREQLVRLVEPFLGNARAVGMPAVLGVTDNETVFEDLRDRIGLPLFEIPAMPPSIAGLRILERFKDHLPSMGIRMFHQHNVDRAEPDGNGGFVFEISRLENRCTIRAKGAVLATGRFFGRGLRADRDKIRETVFDLPVYQDKDRENWHRKIFLDPRGHLVNRFGIETDGDFRPAEKGRAIHENLFAAGSILARQDWIRTKCGTGLAISTAFAAIGAVKKVSGRACPTRDC